MRKQLFLSITALSIVNVILMIYIKITAQIEPRRLDQDPYQSWLEKKKKLNENIGRVCSKYAGYIDKISGRVLDRTMFLHYDKMVNCLIQKV